MYRMPILSCIKSNMYKRMFFTYTKELFSYIERDTRHILKLIKQNIGSINFRGVTILSPDANTRELCTLLTRDNAFLMSFARIFYFSQLMNQWSADICFHFFFASAYILKSFFFVASFKWFTLTSWNSAASSLRLNYA